MAIPIVLLILTRRRRDIPFRHVFWLFGAFIILCGFTHFMEYYTFHSPIYRFAGLLKAVTAVVSWATVLALIPVTPRVLAMRSPEDLEREIAARTAELTETNAELKRQHEEIETLNLQLRRAMAETHHRVKNNLQVVSALVDIQFMSDAPAVPKDEMRRIAHHVQSLALIHELLTKRSKVDTELEFVSARDALNQILPVVRDMLGDRKVSVAVDDVVLSVKHSTAVAVLVNELVSNAAKHGAGVVTIELRSVPESTTNGHNGSADGDNKADSNVRALGLIRLRIWDEGAGFPDGFDPISSAHTGLDLVENLALHDLGGVTSYSNLPGGGACVTVDFEVREDENPVNA